jgi:hypothetical protein
VLFAGLTWLGVWLFFSSAKSKASIGLTFMVAALEFTLLANRPGLLLMLSGTALLISALAFAAKPVGAILALIGVPTLLAASYAWVIAAMAILVLLRQRAGISSRAQHAAS